MKKLYRSEHSKMLAGVCGGLGDYFNVDPTLIRLAWVVITIFPSCGFGLLAYIIAAIVVPVESRVH
ncbi:MAG: PspC domain-containing protein [Firmicutes bacterium]|nr:PspC domain-containing protein [Bacillota bacterium]